MCMKIIASLSDNKINIMARLILILCILHVWRHSKCKQGQLLSNNDYLFAIGNDETGYERLLVVSQLTNTQTISLDGYSVSSACGSHPSRCRELLIESIDSGRFTSTHILLVPLVDGVQILELAYNGSASSNQLRLVTQHRLLFDRVNENHSCGPSLGVHKIGPDYFIPCIGTDHQYYVCELILNLTAVTQSTLQPCRQVDVNLSNVENGASLSSISNSVATNESLIFLIQNVLYELHPRSSSNRPFTYAFPTYCSSVDQLLTSPQDEHKLIVYCRNRNVVTYDLNLRSIARVEEASNIPYPCSLTAEYIVHLSQTQIEFSYKLNSNGNTVIKVFDSPTISMNFQSGACFESAGGNHLFVYTDKSVGTYLFNATSENLWLIPNTLRCSESECELPLVYSNRYIVIRNKLRRNVIVFDALFNRSIINLGNTPLQLVTLISDLPAISLQNIPSTSATNYTEPVDSSGEPNQNDDGTKRGVPLEVVLPVAILLILIVIILIVIIVILVTVIKRCCPGSTTSGKCELQDVTFAKQVQEVVIENHSLPESQPIRIVAAELEIEADNDSSYSNPVYSGESFDDHVHDYEKMPANVIVFENQVTSASSSVDHNVDTAHLQNPEEQMVTDLSNSETQNLIEPNKAGSEDNDLNAAATLEDTNPPSNNQGEVIINVHALSSDSGSLKEGIQPESQPVPPTDQFIIESGGSPSQLNPQFNSVAVRVEEQTVVNGTSSELSLSVDQEFEKGGHISDSAKEREGKGDRRAESAEHTETGETLNPQLDADGEKQPADNGTSSEPSLSTDQKFENGGHVNNDTEKRENESDGSANATAEITEPPPSSNTICTQFNVEREGRFEEGGQFSDDIEENKSEGDRSDKSALLDGATSELSVTLNGREEEASNESLLSPDQDNAGNTSDIKGEENGNKEGEGNNGQEREKLQVMNHSSGLPSETDSSVLESYDPTETAHSHDTDQYQEYIPLDSVLPDPTIDSLPSQEDISDSKEQKEMCANADSDKLLKVEAIASSTNQQQCANERAVDDTDASTSLPSAQQERNNSNPFNYEKEELCEEDALTSDPKVVHPTVTPVALILPVMVPGIEATTHQDEYHTGDPSSVHHDAIKESLEPPEKINEAEEKLSQTSKDDFEATAKEFERVTDQEGGEDHLETREANGGRREDDFEAPAKESKYVMDQEDIGDHLETEESNGDKKYDSKHKVEAPAKELESIMDEEDIGDHMHLETREINGDKGDDFEASAKKLEDQEDKVETKEVNGDEGHNDFETPAKNLEDREESGDHLETKKVNGDKGEDSIEYGNAFNQSPDSLSVVSYDDVNVESHTDQSLGDVTTEKHTPIHLGSTANSEESLTSSSIKSTSRQSDDEVLPSKSPVSTESDLNMSLSSQEDVYKEEEGYNGSMDKDRPTDLLDESPSSQDDSRKEKEEVYNNSTEAGNLEMSSGDIVSANQEEEHNNTEAQADAEGSASNEASIESQEEVLMVSNSGNESYEDIAPIKCTFVGRIVKTVARTSVDSSINQAMSTTVHGENHIGSFSESPPPPLKSFDAEHSKKSSNEEIISTKTSMVIENGDNSPPNNKAILGTPIQESKFGSVNDEMLTESLLGQKVINGILTPLKGANSMDFTSQEREKAEASELQTPKQKFPYKFETVV